MTELRLNSILEAYYQYLTDVDAGEPETPWKACKKLRKRKGDDLAIHPSNLARCPLAGAKSRLGLPRSNPKSFYERGSLLHLLNQGVQDAKPFQQAMIREGGLAEFPIRKDMNGLNGKLYARLMGTLDVLFPAEGNNPPVMMEVKRRDEPKDGSGSLPKLSDAMQMLAYGWMIRNTPELNPITKWDETPYTTNRVMPLMYLVIMTRYTAVVYELVPVDDDNFNLIREDGQFVLTISWSTVFKSIGRVKHYLEAVKELAKQESPDWSLLTPPEFADGGCLNHEDGWECYRWETKNKPKLYVREYKGQTDRKEYAVPRCEHDCIFGGQRKLVEQLEDGTFAFVDEGGAQ